MAHKRPWVLIWVGAYSNEYGIPSKKLNKAKPWISPGIIKSIKRRNKLLRKYIKAKDRKHKQDLHTQYKILGLHHKYFTDYAKDIRKTWAWIKNIINIRTLEKEQPTSMLINKKINN